MNQIKTGKLIAAKRKENKLTQEQLAEKLGVTNKAVSKWETGKCMPDLSLIQPLCEILGLTVAEFLNGEENSDKEEVMLHLLWLIEKLKKFKLIIIGLLVCNIPQVIEPLLVIQNVAEGTFLRGFLDGGFVGMKIIGVCVFAYGIGCYLNAEKKKL